MQLHRLIENIVLTVVCLVLIIPSLIYLYPPVVGADYSYTVLSGSIRPTLYPGDLIIVKVEDPSNINVGDIVTVRSEVGTFTHRVYDKKVEDGVVMFRTKGDANEDPDPAYYDASQLIGKVVVTIPFRYLYTPYGFFIFVLAPTALTIGRQMYSIYDATKRRNRKELIRWRKKRRKTPAIETSTLLLILILTISVTRIVTPRIWISKSYLYDGEISVNNVFSADIWVITVNIDIKPDTLNLESKGNPITCYIWSECDENKIDINTIILDGEISAEWGEVQENGCLMVKFNRASVIEHLISKGYKSGDTVILTLEGMFLDGTRFKGSDTIEVI